MTAMNTRSPLLQLLCALAMLLTATPVLAQEYVPDEAANPDKRPDGWDFSLSLGGNVNLTANKDVVGQANGNAWTLGGNVKGGADYVAGNHESRNTLSLNEVFTKTPNIDEFVRTIDEFMNTPRSTRRSCSSAKTPPAASVG